MSNKAQKVCTTLNHIDHFLILALRLLDVFQFLLSFFYFGIPTRIPRSATGLKICAITAGIKKYMSIIKKKKKKHDKIVLLAKTKLNTIEVLISKVLIGLYISHYEFVSVNNVLKEYDDMKKDSTVQQRC